MKNKILILLILTSINIFSQKDLEKKLNEYTNPGELVTLAENLPFNAAVKLLSSLSEKFTGKPILNNTNFSDAIGIKIDDMPYKRALQIITRFNGLIYEETQNAIVIRNKGDSEKRTANDTYAPVDSREVKISAVFFEANLTEMNSRGINWQTLLTGNKGSINSELRSFGNSNQSESSSQSSTEQQPLDFLSELTGDISIGEFTGSVTAAFSFFESENLGEIIAKPSIIVRDKQKGRIQIGSDISIKQRDFAGNVIDQFYSTGTIIEVTPYIYSEDGVDYVLLKLKVERSSAQPDVVSTEIRKTMASTDILMLDNEETVIGGLYVNEEQTVRNGIPILKDLPWWVLGIRYLTGYDEVQTIKKEIIILIRTELVKSLKERMATKKSERLIQDTYLKDEFEIQKYKARRR